MSVALYATIWVALALFVVGEAGKRASVRGGRFARRAWRASMLGAGLCALHMAIAFHARHAWSLDAARADIARKTGEVFGLSWSGAVWVNFVFVALWLGDGLWWRADAGYAIRPRRWVRWSLRGFFFVVIASGAFVFASPAGRIAGAPLIVALVWVWVWPGGAVRDTR